MSNALLLRLFTSEFFNSWIAVSYLFRYSDNVGIQHYLCAELKSFPISEIEFFLPQLIHLLITKPSESVALECFLIEMFEKSTHIALMSLWYLQAYLSDLCANPMSPSFELCKRLLNKAQAIVFSEQDDDRIAETHRIVQQHQRDSQKVHENSFPALVGMGAVLLGIGQPLMTKPAGRIAIAQGRRNRINSTNDTTLTSHPSLSRRNTTDDTTVENIHASSPSLINKTSDSFHLDVPSSSSSHQYLSSSQPDLPVASSKKKKSHSYFSPFTSSPSLEDLHRGRAFSVTRYIKSAQHKLNKKMIQLGEEQLTATSSLSESRKKKNKHASLPSVFDPSLTALGQSSVPTNTAPLSPALTHYYCSSSEEVMTVIQNDQEENNESFLSQQHNNSKLLTTVTPSNRASDDDIDVDDNSSVNSADSHHSESTMRQSLSKLSIDHRKLLLRSNYFRSEMQFVLALVDIATRLVIVPKEARMSALQAELTLLNHNLPAEICLPLWCPATAEKPFHHRIVRISPADAVVLNSAERAPYLLMIEVLDDEMSFEDNNYLTLSGHHRHRYRHRYRPKRTRKSVEHASISLKDTEDATADMGEMKAVQGNKDSATTIAMHQTPSIQSNNSSRRNSRSADDYAERMRTAAVMLAQLQSSNGITNSLLSKYRSQPSNSAHSTEHIRRKIIKEMMTLEEERMKKMKMEGVGSVVQGNEGVVGDRLLEDEEERMMAWVKMKNNKANNDDPSAAVLSEDWETKRERLRLASPFGHLPNWRLLSVIVKHGADLRQEQFAIQLIREMQRIWEDTGVDVWVK
ncbi:MAG: hypothetical protein EXX96DRAFT_595639 [Benjaminiella poitrasii]|nr:MAG: hypothetical protein EXX96DRAFT_595639 [Benjaminiella poitrasii]